MTYQKILTASFFAIAFPAIAQLEINKSISLEPFSEPSYEQEHRPQFHFTSRKNWLNDPNGMVHDGEKYHLFFQHNPLGNRWGNMTWGHATSPDMIHWTQHGPALIPYKVDGNSGTIFSGTAVMDHPNSLGLQKGNTPTMAAFYTFARDPWEKVPSYQGMAYSQDLGKTWTYYNDGRPVLDNQGFDNGERDPKVFWHEESKQWVMVLWVQKKTEGPEAKEGIVRFFTSKDLKKWELASEFKRDWLFECMDLVQLPLNGNPKQKQWVLYDASFEYEIGNFDGKTFTSTSETLRQQRDKHLGNYYAAQTFNNSPDGRTVIIGWMRCGDLALHLNMPFNQQMSFPSEMSLRNTPAGPRLFLWPVKEIETIVSKRHNSKDLTLGQANDGLYRMPALDLVDLEIDFSPGKADFIHLDLQRISLRWNAETKNLEVEQPTKKGKEWKIFCGPLHPRDGQIQLRLLLDRMSIEAFAFQGEITGAAIYDPRSAPKKQGISAKGADNATKVNSLSVRELKSTWK